MEITMKGISKAFGSNEVLKGVDLTLKSGEIHALMGENGAGKSTLMNILTGIHKADSGTICVDGREISFKNALEAEKCGIAFIHQELNIWPNLSILENLFLMQNVTNSFGMLDFKKCAGWPKKNAVKWVLHCLLTQKQANAAWVSSK